MLPKNKKGLTLVEMMVVVILIAGLAAIAYPNFISALEKSRASEAVQIVSHMLAAQEKFRAECFSDNCAYSPDFYKLRTFLHVAWQNDAGALNVVNQGDTSIVTPNFTYALGDGQITATPTGNTTYRIIGPLDGQLSVLCEVLGAAPRGKRVCSALGALQPNGKYLIN